jgi:pyridoxamine 5'-phosphate oxidase
MASDGTRFERRADYDWGHLTEDEADDDPLTMLKRWMAEASDEEEPEPNAMVVATVDAEGRPHARNVLLRGIGADRRLWFFTNRNSAKGFEIDANPAVALLFSWLEQHRQIRVEGTAAPLGDAESDGYWDARPQESRLSAVASPQSEVIASRAQLEDWVDAVAAKYGDGPVPRPPEWGGYGVAAATYEFWQGRKSRLHDRLRYRRPEPGESPNPAGWVVERLAP